MKPVSVRCRVPAVRALAAFCILAGPARAVTTVFFDAAQTTNLVSSGTTSDTISSEGYLFTYTRDKLFTGGTSEIIGRPVRVQWPDGLEAQYVTTTTNKATIKVSRVDGAVFDLTAFSAKLLANPGAGRAIEIVPLLNGEEPLNDPLVFDVSSGYYGTVHSFDTTTPSYIGSTAALTNYDAYKITLTLDFALTALTVVDASIPPPPDPYMAIAQLGGGTIELSWPSDAVGFALESSTNLPAQTWSMVTNDVVLNGDLFTVQLEATEPHLMYRLQK
jgi:hypothetical protein